MERLEEFLDPPFKKLITFQSLINRYFRLLHDTKITPNQPLSFLKHILILFVILEAHLVCLIT